MRRWMTKKQFLELEEGDRVSIRYMLGEAHVAGPHIEKDAVIDGKTVKNTELPVHFSTGPWAGRTINLVRQQFKP